MGLATVGFEVTVEVGRAGAVGRAGRAVPVGRAGSALRAALEEVAGAALDAEGTAAVGGTSPDVCGGLGGCAVTFGEGLVPLEEADGDTLGVIGVYARITPPRSSSATTARPTTSPTPLLDLG